MERPTRQPAFIWLIRIERGENRYFGAYGPIRADNRGKAQVACEHRVITNGGLRRSVRTVKPLGLAPGRWTASDGPLVKVTPPESSNGPLGAAGTRICGLFTLA
jgi:hypothetical protein